jgi:hypothetical protein
MKNVLNVHFVENAPFAALFVLKNPKKSVSFEGEDPVPQVFSQAKPP